MQNPPLGVKNSEGSGLSLLLISAGILAVAAMWRNFSYAHTAGRRFFLQTAPKAQGKGEPRSGGNRRFARGYESGQERSDAERGGGTPPADWGQQARSTLLPRLRGLLFAVTGNTSAKRVIPRLRGHYLIIVGYARSLSRRGFTLKILKVLKNARVLRLWITFKIPYGVNFQSVSDITK